MQNRLDKGTPLLSLAHPASLGVGTNKSCLHFTEGKTEGPETLDDVFQVIQ